MHFKKLSYLFLYLTLIPLHASKTPQVQAMKLIKLLNRAIDDTNDKQFTKAIQGLFKVDFEKTEAPLSLLIAFTDAFVKYGREDFLKPERKALCAILMKQIASQTYMQFVKQKKYVMSLTKKNTIEKLNNLIEIIDPRQEPCGYTLQNLKYVMGVIKMLPENENALKKGSMILYHTFKAIHEQDEESIKEVFLFLAAHLKEKSNKRAIEDISMVWLLKELVLDNNDADVAFNQLQEMHTHIKSDRVRAETTNAFLEIAIAYYSAMDDTTCKIKEKHAFLAYKEVLKMINKGNLRGKEWSTKSIAIEGLIVLQYKVPNANLVIDKYLKKLEKEDYDKYRFNNKDKSKVGILLSNKDIIIRIVKAIELAKSYGDQRKKISSSEHLDNTIKLQQYKIKKASEELEKIEKLIEENITV